MKSVRVHADRDDEKVPAAREKAWTIDRLHVEIKSKMDELKTKGKFTETDLDTTARDALKTLPYEVALVCLNKIANDTSAISNMNAFIVKNCTHLRNQWGVEDTSSATEEDDDDHREDENYLDAATRNLLCYDGKTRAWLSYVDEQFGTWRDDFPFLELKKLTSTATQNLANAPWDSFSHTLSNLLPHGNPRDRQISNPDSKNCMFLLACQHTSPFPDSKSTCTLLLAVPSSSHTLTILFPCFHQCVLVRLVTGGPHKPRLVVCPPLSSSPPPCTTL